MGKNFTLSEMANVTPFAGYGRPGNNNEVNSDADLGRGILAKGGVTRELKDEAKRRAHAKGTTYHQELGLLARERITVADRAKRAAKESAQYSLPGVREYAAQGLTLQDVLGGDDTTSFADVLALRESEADKPISDGIEAWLDFIRDQHGEISRKQRNALIQGLLALCNAFPGTDPRRPALAIPEEQVVALVNQVMGTRVTPPPTNWGALLKETAQAFRSLKPWLRRLFPFVLDLKLLDPAIAEVRVEITAQTMPMLTLTLPSFILHVGPLDQPWVVVERDKPVVICAALAVIDLLTRELRQVEGRKDITKRIRPDKRLPVIGVRYRPVIYAPKTVTVQVPRTPEDLRTKEHVAERSEPNRKPEQVSAPPADIADATAAAEKREIVRHHVQSFIRNRRMSLRQQKRLLELIAQGIVPTDKLGNPIPLPTDGQYTIVLEHERGSLEPEVVSRSVLGLVAKELVTAS